VKYDPDGNHIWSKRFGGGGAVPAYAVAASASSDVVIAGAFDAPVDFGGGTLTTSGQADIFVAKLDPDGNHIWSRAFGASGNQIVLEAASTAPAVSSSRGPTTASSPLEVTCLPQLRRATVIS
jgi:hypothetical protein